MYARSNGNDLYIEMYAGLLVHTLRHLRLPDMEFALHNGKDLPVMQKHEVSSSATMCRCIGRARGLFDCGRAG